MTISTRSILAAAAGCALLAGCADVPYNGYGYDDPYAYNDYPGYYGPGYVDPGPAVGFGFEFRDRDHREHHDFDRDHDRDHHFDRDHDHDRDHDRGDHDHGGGHDRGGNDHGSGG